MTKTIPIRENIPAYLADLRAWLAETRDQPLEDMSAFFRQRLAGYEDHMALWREAYGKLAALIPTQVRHILDLGCGTGLELDAIFHLRQDIAVTGVDLCPDMLARLREKHPQVKTICGDYLSLDLGLSQYDCVITFESLHHLRPEQKQRLFQSIHRALTPGGVFLEADYLACCEEEERLLMDACRDKRRRQGIPEDAFIHFDTPLTVDHETALLEQAGFSQVEHLCSIQGASLLRCVKADGLMTVRTYPFGTLRQYKYAGVLSEYNGRILLSRHRDRTTWEHQGGHIEPGELPIDAARRELYEESGAVEFDIAPLCDYWAGVAGTDDQANGTVFTAHIRRLEHIPKSEMAEVRQFDALPENLTYPAIATELFAYLDAHKKEDL